MTTTPAAGIPAATLVLFREGSDDVPPEHLFVVRATTMAFAGGAVVFPGGRVDPGDRALAGRWPALDPDDAAARVAAIRETIEETGIAVGIAIGIAGHPDIAEWRGALASGTDFGTLIDAASVTLDLAALVPFARWCPNAHHHARTFDTRFYVARAPADGSVASVDETENARLFWATAAEVLDRCGAGELRAIFPTRRTLERLSALGHLDAAIADAARRPPTVVTPWIDGDLLRIPDGLGYPVTAEPVATALRG